MASIFADLDFTLQCIHGLLSVTILLQSIEYLRIESTFTSQGVWRWDTLKVEVAPFPIKSLLTLLMNHPNFTLVIWIRFLSALLLPFFPHPLSYGVLLFTGLLISLRWRGSFNGGSDYMVTLVLSALWLCSLFDPSYNPQTIAFWYIAFHVCASYFVAGWVKLRNPQWRNGQALQWFLKTSIYSSPSIPSMSKNWSRGLSLLVILFECSFPLALLHPHLATLYLCAGLIFHLINFYYFGLNRFFFAWTTAYPALLFCSI